MKNLLYFLLFITVILYSTPAFTQDKATLNGYIRDADSGEALIGATVAIVELDGTGTISNTYGYYSLTVPKGIYTLQFSYLGYQPKAIEMELDQNQRLDLELNSGEVELEEVVISSERIDSKVLDVEMSRESLTIETIKSMPALFGEVDIIKSIQLLPGIQSAGEGTTGFFVRGGSSDQNLVLLDEATVYNAAHFLGFFSVFNPDAIKNVEIYKGGIPAQFGGRLSSILDIQMKEGNNKRFAMSGGIGTISSRFTIEGPIVADKSSFVVSARRTYADVFLKLSPDENINSNILYFYDLNAKANVQLNDRNKIFLSGYFGRDVFNFDNTFGLNWGNATGTFRWNHLFSNRLFLNTTFLYSSFDYGFSVDDEVNNFDWKSNLKEQSLKLDFTYYANPDNQIAFGSNTIYHQFAPANITPGDNSIFETLALDKKYAVEQAFYASNDHKISQKFSLQYGLRYSIFNNVGASRVFIYEEGKPRIDGAITDTLYYDRFEKVKLYHGLEPRLGARLLVSETSSIKASFNRMRQYLQIASNSTAGLPIDRWIPADTYIKPLIGDQVALGYFHDFKQSAFETSVEFYYKWMNNLVDFKPNAEILLNNNIETEVLEGRGWAYGAEFLVRKNIGKTTGWIAYTLARTQRKIDGINRGQAYNARYDRTHDIAVVASHDLNKRLTLSANWVFTTGSAVSFPVGKYDVDGKTIPFYNDRQRNQNRMPNYHRLDLSATLEGKNRHNRKWHGSWNFSIYNAYARKNTFSISFEEVRNGNPDFDEDEDGPVTDRKLSAVKLYLFSIIPSVTYNFKF